MYGKDLPNQDVVDIERKLLECGEKLRPKIIASSLKKCSKDMYPNLSVLLKLPATLPITSSECKKIFPVLRNVQTWLRTQ